MYRQQLINQSLRERSKIFFDDIERNMLREKITWNMSSEEDGDPYPEDQTFGFKLEMTLKTDII